MISATVAPRRRARRHLDAVIFNYIHELSGSLNRRTDHAAPGAGRMSSPKFPASFE
jgi:hypothetical protein